MKIRCGHYIHRLRRWLFMLCLSLLVVCLGKLVSMMVFVRHGGDIKPHGVNASHAFRSNINCDAIYEMDPVEVGRALQRRREPAVDANDAGDALLTYDCQTFIRNRGYQNVPVAEVERSFPLAYTLVVHKNAPMVERILRAIYAPQNVYCLHYDQKSSPAFITAMAKLAACLPNVFIASKLESVEYAHISRLKADLNCLSDLLRSPVQWKYVINLCGQDFPLKSNYELVKELQRLNGSNMLESGRPSPLKEQRFSFRYQLRTVPYEYHRIPVKTTLAKDPPPHGIQMFIGSAYFVLSREFVVHISGSQLVKDFLLWSEDTYSPDEHFWATLVRVPGVPGHIPRPDPDISDLRSKTRLVKWNYLEGVLYPACTGMHRRSVCIYGAAELRWLLNYGHWFANKFDPKVDPVLIDCLEEKLTEKRWKVKT